LHLDARGWCDEVFVNLILPIRAQHAFLVLIATPNRNRYHESAAVEGKALVGTNSSATVDGRRARGCLGSLRRSYAPSRLVFRVMRKVQRPAPTTRKKCFYPLILRMSQILNEMRKHSGRFALRRVMEYASLGAGKKPGTKSSVMPLSTHPRSRVRSGQRNCRGPRCRTMRSLWLGWFGSLCHKGISEPNP